MRATMPVPTVNPRVAVTVALWVVAVSGCNPDVTVDDRTRRPRPTAADARWAGVFRVLDGSWRGSFHIYERPGGQAAGPVRPRDLAVEPFPPRGLELRQTMEAEQTYRSETPYFQRVVIRDAIRGWGYFGDDDPAAAPRVWFHGVYHRVAAAAPAAGD